MCSRDRTSLEPVRILVSFQRIERICPQDPKEQVARSHVALVGDIDSLYLSYCLCPFR